MYKIDLNEYKYDFIYFNYFDCLLKNESINKDDKLEELGISPSSYRRSRKESTKITKEILKKLSNHYGLMMIDDNEIDQIEKLLNDIYLDVYFKIDGNIEKYFKELENQISRKIILKPILELFIIFLKANQYKSPKHFIETTYDDYKRINELKGFFTKNLEEINVICGLIFERKFENIKVEVNYKSALTYYLFAAKFNITGKYLNSLYCAEKAKSMLINENNLKRICSLNMIVLSDYNSIKNYQDALDLANTQLLLLRSFNYLGDEYYGTYTHFYISLLGLKQYERIENELKYPKNTTDYIVLMIAKNALGKSIDEVRDNAIENFEASKNTTLLVYSILRTKCYKRFQNELKLVNIRYSLKQIIEQICQKN